MIEVAPYTPEHRDQVFELVRQFYEDSLEAYNLSLDDKSIARYEKTHGPTTFVLLNSGVVIGVLSGQITNQPMSDKKVFQELIWYVDKRYRDQGTKLLRYLESWCLAEGVDQIIMAFMHNSMSDRLFDFYERNGYKAMETHMIKEVV